MLYNIENQLMNIQQNPLKKSRFIIAHESGNPNNTGTNSLLNEVAFMKRNWQNAFVSHWIGSGARIIQIAQTGKVQWGAGPNCNPYAYAQVELARTNRYSTFQQDYKAYIWLLRHLAQEAGLPMSLNTGNSVSHPGIKTHAWVSRHLGGTDHSDPEGYLESWGVGMAQFQTDLQNAKAYSQELPVKQTGDKYQLYLVRKGDTLWSISLLYDTTVAQLKAWNQLHSDLILIGQILKVKQL